MNEQLQAFIRDLAPVLEKHRASIYSTMDNDGIHVGVEGSSEFESVFLGFISDGTSDVLNQLLNK